MKRLLLLASLTTLSFPTFAADVGVSVSVAEPGFYGRIDIGSFPQPPVVNSQPVVIQPVVVAQPIYMHVPPGHAKNWAKHCHEYNACGHKVYFVKDNWYNDVYVPQKKGGGKGHGNGHGHGKHKD